MRKLIRRWINGRRVRVNYEPYRVNCKPVETTNDIRNRAVRLECNLPAAKHPQLPSIL